MPSVERDSSRDSERYLRHQQTPSSDVSRAIVPMWDSSDPERAPPPLPMNPSSPIVASRPHTSTAIKNAHAALTEKARENTYITNPPPKRLEPSPERSLIVKTAHKRMQSLQPGNVRDLSSFLESGTAFSSPTSPEKSAKRPSTPHGPKDFFLEGLSLEKPPEKEDCHTPRSTTPTPSRDSSTRDMMSVRPSLRRPPQSILGENTPPQSATMIALQSMASKDADAPPPLSNVTNGSTAANRTPQTFDAISNQILSLTSIATSLQREMAQLSRRSKDNATDLVSLKEATNARDEDIRKSLRELVSNLSESGSRSPPSDLYQNPIYLDAKALHTKNIKPFTLPRIPSPNSFAASLDRESVTSASACPFGVENAASVALLEKILRDMGTKEGQENLVAKLMEVGERLSKDEVSTAKKLEELLEVVKSNSTQSMVTQKPANTGNRPRTFSFDDSPNLELDFDQPKSEISARVEALFGGLGPNKESQSAPGSVRGADIVNDELMKIIRTIKDSVAQGGGLTAEVKALVRELRGEVLGMGREIGRKLEQANSKDSGAKDLAAEKNQIARVVNNGLEELKQHMDDVLRENQRETASAVVRNPVDYQEIYNAMRAAINEKPKESGTPELVKDDIIGAVREAWETYKPDIEVEHFGLEREELLACLKEGIQEYVPQNSAQDVGGATREEVFEAVIEGLKHFSPPRVETEASLSREEILDAVRECLEEFEFPAAPMPEPREPEVTRMDMLHAVQEGLQSFDFAATSTALTHDVGGNVTRNDMLDAVKEGLHTFDFATTSNRIKESSITREDVLHAVNEGLHTFDFTEHTPTRDDLLDTVKEGLESFDFPNAPTTRDELLEIVTEALHIFDFPTTSTSTAAAMTRDEILDAIKDGINNSDFGSNSMALSKDVGGPLNRNDVYDAVRAGIREAPIQRDPWSEQVLERLQELMDYVEDGFKGVSDEAKQNIAASGRDTEQLLDASKDSFENLRADIEAYVDQVASGINKDEILESISENFSKLSVDIETLLASKPENSMEIVRGELEHLRGAMATALVRPDGNIDRDEFLDALRDGFNSIRADMDKPQENPNEVILSGNREIMETLDEGLTGLRAEIEKVHNKPVDMTVNYEILDTLKLGLEGVRADLDRLRENGFGETAVAEINSRAIVTTDNKETGLKRNDIENLEVLITQLRIKVESLDSVPPQPSEPAPGLLSKDDLVSVERKLASVQESVIDMLNRDRAPPSDEEIIKREDIEAIETLLRNTKAKIDDIDPEQAVKKEHLDAVEVLLFETRESITELKTHLDDVTKTDDISMVEGLLRGVVEGLDEMKQRMDKEEQNVEKVTKTDVEAVEAVCLDVKAAIEQRVLPDIADLASKGDVKTLGDLVKEVNGRIETHAESNAKSFEERQAETVGVGERVSEVRTFLEEFKEAVREKMEEGSSNLATLGKFLESMGETVGQNANVTDDIKDMFEMVKSEFEKSNAGVVGSKLDADEKFQTTWDKFDAKLDEKFDELMMKYEDAELAADAKAKAVDEKMAEVEVATLSTKTVGEEVKLLVDTLGATVTDSVEKMDEASKTVFNRVDETFTRVEEYHIDAKTEHQLTREEVFKSIAAIEGVQGQVTEYSPKILESIKDVLVMVGEHFEHSKTATTTIQQKIADIPPPPPPVQMIEPPEIEKYDDAPVHEKLDKLVDHMQAAGKSFSQLDMLDQIHQKVLQTAAEVSEFVSAQTQRIADEHEDREKAVEAATIALEKRNSQKEQVEATIVGLREEELQLKGSVATLKTEQDVLSAQKMKLSADVSGLETALRIRREELHEMEARAAQLERRILEGVIDHSRAFLLSKSNTKGRDAMSRKRVPSHATSTTGSIASSAVTAPRPTSRASHTSNVTQSAVNMAMNGNRTLMKVPSNNTTGGASRRILSLNQITHNVPTGAMAHSMPPGGMKRSHSVKSSALSAVPRKTSWGGSMKNKKYGDLNKENLALKESEEDELSDADHQSEGDRRTSMGTTILTSTGTGLSESVIDEGTEWTGSIDGDSDSQVTGSTITEGEDEPAAMVLYDEEAMAVAA
ncbi:hypothetical protein HYFRA_00000641 [Hymenoscyphus fraxineus]|uniref:Chromosome segregation ATPase family protein n=1 Tax=Hymenoscyphus fraxineus TaxID=746836 RepID=A0A9N9L1U1_9HELO|nr:hypothetical protein HYFRA_00000641 [Hymenoscyphus fraxineus]